MSKLFTTVLTPLFPLLLILGVFLNPQSASVAQEKKPHPQEQLDTTIAEMIRLLQEKEHKKLILEFSIPEELEVLKQTNNVDALFDAFAKNGAPKLLNALKKAAELKPVMSEDGLVAEFIFPEEINGNKKMFFKKIDKKWYLQNRTS
ncbi:hypothetical protein Plim_1934 [Planctopirus limnophila DSM 3776]|uniref:DUF4878 domain-containing protein n=1 Tax=Planctopirus limnophila (strain ATCC 43296 / DSM 3776 / IFAM 1008 / Mu 290) TaxID=521674 RepID=D5SXS7_PLAL2|nr:hypothetical protein [Planctopirus limnophila]ADG67764.1 hypothetical protein Plim_1934 [Planctopirus limnophila DSM 3776]